MQETANAVFLTGATGFLGMELLARYMERTDRHVFALVRGDDDRQVKQRLERTLVDVFGPEHPYGERVTAVLGDITRPGLGVAGGLDWLSEQVDEVVHSAACVSFELRVQAARAINVAGTQRVLDFAERCRARGGLRRVSHVSTAYVAGERSGCFSEDDLAVGQRFRNAYELSKFEAETLITRSRSELPVTIFRPSIIVGDRSSGWTAAFNVLYWPLRAFSRGSYAMMPGRRDAPVDVVPVDYVADAMFELSQRREAVGATFHLTAGANASSVGEVIGLATAFFKRPEPRLVEPSLYRNVVHPLLVRTTSDERSRRALVRSELFFPYFAVQTGFDDRRCRVALRGAGIATTPLRAYFDRLIQFAIAAQWGRRPISRARANGRWEPHDGHAAGAAHARARLAVAE